MSEYPKFGSIPRLNRPVVVSEKIDGTNGLIWIIAPDDETDATIDAVPLLPNAARTTSDGTEVYAGSRNRWLCRDQDNAGFHAWVMQNAETLAADLGPGHHYGEWWGSGIQRGYGLDHKRFSLFNTHRWADKEFATPNLGVVPVLGYLPSIADSLGLRALTDNLDHYGSFAAPGYMNPEGVVLYHAASKQLYKVTREHDDMPKSLAAAA